MSDFFDFDLYESDEFTHRWALLGQRLGVTSHDESVERSTTNDVLSHEEEGHESIMRTDRYNDCQDSTLSDRELHDQLFGEDRDYHSNDTRFASTVQPLGVAEVAPIAMRSISQSLTLPPPAPPQTLVENDERLTSLVEPETTLSQSYQSPMSHSGHYQQQFSLITDPRPQSDQAFSTPPHRLQTAIRTPMPFGSALMVTPQLRNLLKPIPAKSGVRYDCQQCGGDVVVNGKNNGVLCTRCFNAKDKAIEINNYRVQKAASRPVASSAPYESARALRDVPNIRTAQPDLPPSDQPRISIAKSNAEDLYSPADFEEEDGTASSCLKIGPGDLEFVTMDAARAHLLHPSAKDCQQLGIEDDDWLTVKYENFFKFCSELFNVLQIPGKHSLANPAAGDGDYSRRNHNKKLQSVRRAMQTPEQTRKAKARVMCIIDDIIRVHEIGIPKAAFDKAHTKTHRGCEPDTGFRCSERILKVIELAKDSKYVACDILEGKINDLVLSPLYCIGRKNANLKTNAKRSQQIALSRDLRKCEGVSSETQAQRNGKRSEQHGTLLLQQPLDRNTVAAGYVRQPVAVHNAAAGCKRDANEDIGVQHMVDKRARTAENYDSSVCPDTFVFA